MEDSSFFIKTGDNVLFSIVSRAGIGINDLKYEFFLKTEPAAFAAGPVIKRFLITAGANPRPTGWFLAVIYLIMSKNTLFIIVEENPASAAVF